MVEILKQGQYDTLPVSKQILIIYAGTNGYIDDLPIGVIKKFESEFYKYMDGQHPDIVIEIETKHFLSEELMLKLNSVIAAFKEDFKKRNNLLIKV